MTEDSIEKNNENIYGEAGQTSAQQGETENPAERQSSGYVPAPEYGAYAADSVPADLVFGQGSASSDSVSSDSAYRADLNQTAQSMAVQNMSAQSSAVPSAEQAADTTVVPQSDVSRQDVSSESQQSTAAQSYQDTQTYSAASQYQAAQPTNPAQFVNSAQPGMIQPGMAQPASQPSAQHAQGAQPGIVPPGYPAGGYSADGYPAGGQNPLNGQLPQDAQPAAKQSSNSFSSAFIAAVLTAVLCFGGVYVSISNGWLKVPSSSSMSKLSDSTGGAGSAAVSEGQAVDWAAVAKKVANSVVAITVETSSGSAKGSGAIVDAKGNIVTNNHVVSGGKQIAVALADGRLYSASIVGTDATTDLAVIKLKNAPSDLTPATFADSDKLAVGENVMAVGNPLGYANTVTSGIVSALNRPVTVTDDSSNTVVTNAVQIDAAINPGNSGGPTFNAAGEIIGINSSIATASQSTDSSSSSGSIGIGFAIPANLAKRVSDEIVSSGSVKHVSLGVTVTAVQVEADGVTRIGANVKSVVSGSAAEAAGIKAGDTIVAYDDHAVASNYSLLGFVRAAAYGSTAKITVVRDGNTLDLNVKLDKEETASNQSKTESNSNPYNKLFGGN